MPGQKLKIVVPADQQEHYASVTHMSFSDKQKLSDMQMVQSGEQKKNLKWCITPSNQAIHCGLSLKSIRKIRSQHCRK